MSAERESVESDAERETAGPRGATLAELVAERCPFGPGFFATQLGGLVRERCPDPAEHIPSVELHLAEGTVLDVCHVIGLAPTWVALAVYEDRKRSHDAMRTELVAYATILRVTIRAGRSQDPPIGFQQDRSPAMLDACTPEAGLRALAITHDEATSASRQKW